MRKRTFADRFDAIEDATKRKADFLARVEASKADPDALGHLMAESIDMAIEANGLETIDKAGRSLVCVEQIFAAHCMIAARDAYQAATTQQSLSAA